MSNMLLLFVPGEPQKSVSMVFGLNLVLSPKSQSFRSVHLPVSVSKETRMFSGFRSVSWGEMQKIHSIM